jgi:hypothetical protein
VNSYFFNASLARVYIHLIYYIHTLTLALSLRERELILLLPEGEGRDEGEI